MRRASFKDVAKASDVANFGGDLSHVQLYVLNGSKVVYLSREAASERKPSGGSVAPAYCVVDGRSLMDKGNLYCCIKCKLMVREGWAWAGQPLISYGSL